MKQYNNPDRFEWSSIVTRPAMATASLQDTVKTILQDVKLNGDEAVKKYTTQFDNVETDDLQVSAKELKKASRSLSPSLKKAIKTAAANIRLFHKKQLQRPKIIEIMPGIKCWRKSVGIEKCGLYIPGGTAPLFSTVLMLGIPARLAGCKEIILVSPPVASADGKGTTIHPAILFAAQLVGVTKIFKAGGVQAIAAMAYGTTTIPAVNKIFGPGNQYVNCAKQMVQLEGVAIDMPAGPSEVCVLADETCVPRFVAADLLSQAEHGTDSQVLLVTNSESIIEKILSELEKQLQTLPRRDIIEQVLSHSKVVFFRGMNEAVELVNEYAPEHLIIACAHAEVIAEQIVNAGSVFLGNYAPESAGDYASGTNHTLPTNGFAKSYSGVSVDSFIRKITFQHITKTGLENIAETIEEMAAAEGLEAHRRAVGVRLADS